MNCLFVTPEQVRGDKSACGVTKVKNTKNKGLLSPKKQDIKKRRYWKYRLYMLNSGLAIHAKNTVPEHTKRGVVAQVHFCESSQSVTTKTSIHKLFFKC